MQKQTLPTQFSEYADLPAIVERIDDLVYEAGKLRGAERKSKLDEAQRLADAYNDHCKAGGNTVTQFRNFLQY